MTAVGVDPIVRAALRTALALLFAWAAAHKLRDMAAFRAAVAAYALVPAGALSVVSALAVGTEIGVAVTLAWPSAGSVPAVGAALLLVIYASAVAVNLRRGRDHIDCGCVGAAGRRPIAWALVARNVALSGVALTAALPATRTAARLDRCRHARGGRRRARAALCRGRWDVGARAAAGTAGGGSAHRRPRRGRPWLRH